MVLLVLAKVAERADDELGTFSSRPAAAFLADRLATTFTAAAVGVRPPGSCRAFALRLLIRRLPSVLGGRSRQDKVA